MTGLKSMVGRFSLLIIVFALGVASVSLWPSLPQSLRKTLGLASTPGAAQLHADTSGAPTPTEAGTEKQEIKLTKEQIADAHIDLAAAQPASLARRIIVPGSITPAAGRIARVSVKLEGTVAELRKNLGDPVEQNEVLAILESREVADAKSEYLAARLSNELQQELFQRDRKLYEGKVLTEQQFLRSRNLTAQTEMKFNIARQKLFALGLGQDEIVTLPDEPAGGHRLVHVQGQPAFRGAVGDHRPWRGCGGWCRTTPPCRRGRPAADAGRRSSPPRSSPARQPRG
jgi:cobalt-zinc-cadmium efflux system membrane fusion protein